MFLKHCVKRKLRLYSLYFPQNTIMLIESRWEFSNFRSIFRLCALRYLHAIKTAYHATTFFWRFTGMSKLFSISPGTHFLKYFCSKFCEILTSGSREIGVFSRQFFCIQSQILTYSANAPFNWILSVTKKNLRIARFFASISFVTETLWWKTKTITTLRSIMKKNTTESAGMKWSLNRHLACLYVFFLFETVVRALNRMH